LVGQMTMWPTIRIGCAGRLIPNSQLPGRRRA
jgi:hypothetical protein